MKFCYDHDLHIHSTLSVCGNDPEHYNLFDFIIVPTAHMHMGELVVADKHPLAKDWR